MKLVVVSLLVVAQSAIAQTPTTSPASRLGVFGAYQGAWEGEAWMIRGPEGRITVRQQEWVSLEAGGTVVTVKGLGTISRAGKLDTVHLAFAVIHPSLREEGAVIMRAFTTDGRWLDPAITRTPNGYNWTMTDPRAGQIKYEMSFDEQGRWIENGYFSRDNGTTWQQFMGMVLTRKQ